jgi:hypothetical protein
MADVRPQAKRVPSVLSIGDAVVGGTPKAVLFINSTGHLAEDVNKIAWDDAAFVLAFPAEGEAIEFGSIHEPFRLVTGHYSNLGVDDPYIALGYNISEGVSAASHPITPGVAQFQVQIEGNWNPVGGYTQVEWNSDYWSPDGMTHRRGFLHQIRNDNFEQTWNWFAKSYFWSNDDNSANFFRLDALNAQYSTGTLGIGTPIGTGTTNIYNSSANPTWILNCTTSAANNRLWDVFLSGTVLEFRLVNDADTLAVDWMSVSRTANVVNNITFGGPVYHVNGTAGAPGVSFVGAHDSGINFDTLNVFMNFAVGGVDYVGISGNTVQLLKDVQLGWTTGIGTVGSDTYFTRSATGDLIITTADKVQFGTFTGLGAEILAGYITVKDHGGTTRKLAVIA